MNRFLGVLFICLVGAYAHANYALLKDIKKAIRECNISAVKSGFSKLDQEVDSPEELKKYLGTLIIIAKRVVKNPPSIAPEGSMAVRIARGLVSRVLIGFGALGLCGAGYLISQNIRTAFLDTKDLDYSQARHIYAAKDNMALGTMGGILNGAIFGIGMWQFLKDRAKPGLPYAEAIEAYLQNELSSLLENKEDDDDDV